MPACLRNWVKGQDIPARFGGEEFCVILPETDLAGAYKLACKICVSIASQRPRLKNTKTELEPITLSIGVAQLRPEDSADSFVERADKAMYAAKTGGRNQAKTEQDLKEAA